MATRAAKLALRGKALTDTGTEIGIVNNADATAITINTAGNVGIGLTPETDWHSSKDALQLGAGASIYGDTTATGNQISANARATVGSTLNGYKYISTDKASTYHQYDGAHNFRVAPSGTADAAISWNTAMIINNAGIVTKPLQPAAVAYNMPNHNNGTLVYSIEKFDNAGNMNITNGRFTCPVAGVYSVSISGFYDNGRANNGDVTIRVNNSVYVRATYSNESQSTYVAITGVSLVKVAANDYITIFTEGDMHSNDATVFSVHLVG